MHVLKLFFASRKYVMCDMVLMVFTKTNFIFHYSVQMVVLQSYHTLQALHFVSFQLYGNNYERLVTFFHYRICKTLWTIMKPSTTEKNIFHLPHKFLILTLRSVILMSSGGYLIKNFSSPIRSYFSSTSFL